MHPGKSEQRRAEQSAPASARPCPICGKASSFATRPFCSKRCADIDLHRWLGGVYAIPVAGDDDARSSPASAPEDSED